MAPTISSGPCLPTLISGTRCRRRSQPQPDRTEDRAGKRTLQHDRSAVPSEHAVSGRSPRSSHLGANSTLRVSLTRYPRAVFDSGSSVEGSPPAERTPPHKLVLRSAIPGLLETVDWYTLRLVGYPAISLVDDLLMLCRQREKRDLRVHLPSDRTLDYAEETGHRS